MAKTSYPFGGLVSLALFDEPWNMGVSVFVVMRDEHGTVKHMGQPVIMEPFDDPMGIEFPRATIQLRREVVQGLVDELHRLGYRPTKGEDNAGVVAAMREHIGDLRKFIFERGGRE